jgi:hypothetical protein
MKKKASSKKLKRTAPPNAPTLYPWDVKLEDALKGVRVGDYTLLAFYLDDVRVEKDYYTGEKRNIPRLLLHVKDRVTVEVYGSHLETAADRELTHVVYSPPDYFLVHEPEFGRPYPPYIYMIYRCVKGWVISSTSKTSIKGEATKTIFQGVVDDPDLHRVLDAVEELKTSPVDYMESHHLPGGEKKTRRVGEDLLNFLGPVIRTSNYRKLRLIEKCLRYLDSATKTKSDRYCLPLRKACEALGRLPTAPELYSRVLETGYQIKESRFYSDLADLGLGWLTRKHSSKTPVGRATK